MVASLATAAAHEINNPLAVVMGQAQLLIDDIAATRRDRIQEILEAAGRIHAIVARMKHLTRIKMIDGSSNLPEMLDIRKSSELDKGAGSWTAVAGLQIAARYLVIVAERSGYENLKETLADESADVILDRRRDERRRCRVPVEVERRRGSRRRHDITTDLQKHGWAIVPNGSPCVGISPFGSDVGLTKSAIRSI